MERQIVALVPSQRGKAVVMTAESSRTISGTDKLLEFLEQHPPSMVLGVMGGPSQNLFVRASQLDHAVCRIPWFTLQRLSGLDKGKPAEERAQALLRAWETTPAAFYALGEFDERMFRLRELTRVRLTIQQVYRIPAELQYQATFRDLEPLLPEGKKFEAIRTVFAQPQMIAGAKADEKVLESQITSLTKGMDIWGWLHPEDGSALPAVKGLGPSLGGSLIGEIGDIRRFPSASHLRSYARFSLTADGQFPRRQRGMVASWNRYLDRAVWLWSTDQMPRWRGTVWRDLYDWKKAMEMQAHPEPVAELVERKDGGVSTVYRYTLGHLDARAKRWVGSQLLEYLYELWTAGNAGDPEIWYAGSRWPERFERAQRELEAGLYSYLDEEVPKRRRPVPAEA